MGNMGLQGVTRGYGGLKEVTGGYKGLEEVIISNTGLQELIRGYKRVTMSTMRLQGVTKG